MAVTNWINYAAIKPMDSPFKDMFANILAGYKMQREPTKIRQEELLRELGNQLKQKEVEYYAPNIESEMNLRGAQAGLLGQQSKYYPEKMEWERDLRRAQAREAVAKALGQERINKIVDKEDADLDEGYDFGDVYSTTSPTGGVPTKATTSPASLEGATFDIAQKIASLTGIDSLANALKTVKENPLMNVALSRPDAFDSLDPQTQINTVISANKNHPYGIALPSTRKGVIEKATTGSTSRYGAQTNSAIKQIDEQRKLYRDEGMANALQNQSMDEHMQQVKQYNALMDKTTQRGTSLMGKTGGVFKSQIADDIDKIANNIALKGIENLRAAMGNAKFTNMDLQIASNMKLNRQWSDEARARYTQWSKGVKNRMDERSKFFSIASNPRMGIPHDMAIKLWDRFQAHHPISLTPNASNPEELRIAQYKKDSWKKYLTPEAVRSVVMTGDYKPKESDLKASTKVLKTIEKYDDDELQAEKRRREQRNSQKA